MPVRRLLLASFLLLGCGTEAPVPDKPTWAEDVLPILRGNCFHCHGPSAAAIRAKNPKVGIYRWDVYDLNDPNYATLGFAEISEGTPPAKVFMSANTQAHFMVALAYLKPDAPEGSRMPPAPATRLSARDLSVLENWVKNNLAAGAHSPNHKPAISWLQKNKVLAVTDEDGDQVLSKLDCGGMEVLLDRSGSHTLPAGVSGPCAATLYDGWGDLTTTELK
jgi:hypothetical protein